jgi:hypothetical protein
MFCVPAMRGNRLCARSFRYFVAWKIAEMRAATNVEPVSGSDTV